MIAVALGKDSYRFHFTYQTDLDFSRRRGSDNERARGSREGLKRRTTSRGRLSKPSPGCKLKKKQFRIVIVKPCKKSYQPSEAPKIFVSCR